MTEVLIYGDKGIDQRIT